MEMLGSNDIDTETGPQTGRETSSDVVRTNCIWNWRKEMCQTQKPAE